MLLLVTTWTEWGTNLIFCVALGCALIWTGGALLALWKMKPPK